MVMDVLLRGIEREEGLDRFPNVKVDPHLYRNGPLLLDHVEDGLPGHARKLLRSHAQGLVGVDFLCRPYGLDGLSPELLEGAAFPVIVDPQAPAPVPDDAVDLVLSVD